MEHETVLMQEIFRFRRRGIDKDGLILGEFETTGIRPQIMDLIAARGVDLPSMAFAVGRKTA
jgi:pilus assembly protein CpaF